MCYIGDGNNMANSLIVGGLKTGHEGFHRNAGWTTVRTTEVMAFRSSRTRTFFITGK